MTHPKVDACKGICAKWDNLTDEQVEQEGYVWCPRCYVHVMPERSHCVCCGKTQIYGLGKTIKQNCLHCENPFMAKKLTVRFCSEECREERKILTKRARAKAYYLEKNGGAKQ